MNDPMKLLTKEEVQKLLNVLKSYLPKSCTAHYFIELQTRWKEEVKGHNCGVFCPTDNLYSGNVFAIYYGSAVGRLVVGTFYCNNDEEGFKQSLLKSNLIPWDKVQWIHPVIYKNLKLIQHIFKAKNIEVLYLDPANLFYMDAADAKNYPEQKIPNKVRIDPLKMCHFDIVAENWPYFEENVRDALSNEILRNFSSGVFVTVDGKEELVAMTIQTDYGGIGRLQTVPKYRRKGYGLLALADLTRKMGEAGISPHVYVNLKNHVSLAFFKKTPYEHICEAAWVVLKH